MKEIILNLVFCTLGAFLAAFALECFLVPNQIIDGGVVGISIMASYITKINLGIFLVALNLPFLFMAWNEFGKKFIFLALYSVAMLAIFVNVTHHIPVITKDLLLSALFGGGILGTGVGLVLKNNACMDGTEILSMKIAKKLPYSVGELIMFFNVFFEVSPEAVFCCNSAIAFLNLMSVISSIAMGRPLPSQTMCPAELCSFRCRASTPNAAFELLQVS